MVTLRRLTFLVVAGLVLGTGGCRDEVLTPGNPDHADAIVLDHSESLLGGLLRPRGGRSVTVLERTRSLGKDETASVRMGLLGATLRLPEAGLTVIIPAGAAPWGTRISVRAPAGDLVGYHFAPHGLRFRLPVTLVQDLSGTEAEHEIVRPLLGAYFEHELEPVLNPLEILPLRVTIGGLAIMEINHFSGYVVATN